MLPPAFPARMLHQGGSHDCGSGRFRRWACGLLGVCALVENFPPPEAPEAGWTLAAGDPVEPLGS